MLTRTQVKAIQIDLSKADERMPFIFNALSDSGRYRIFKLLIEHRDLCVTDVANVLGISVPAASQQLKVMEMSGVIERERSGQMICYSVKRDDAVVRSIMRIIGAD